jgi:hypothetical protein
MSAPQQAETPKLSPRRCNVAHAWLTSPVYQQLLLEAQRRGEEHPDRLAAAIVTAVLVNGYTDGVLQVL